MTDRITLTEHERQALYVIPPANDDDPLPATRRYPVEIVERTVFELEADAPHKPIAMRLLPIVEKERAA